jgi:hypothetical protein
MSRRFNAWFTNPAAGAVGAAPVSGKCRPPRWRNDAMTLMPDKVLPLIQNLRKLLEILRQAVAAVAKMRRLFRAKPGTRVSLSGRCLFRIVRRISTVGLRL